MEQMTNRFCCHNPAPLELLVLMQQENDDVIRVNEDKAIRRVMDLISISGGSCQEQDVSAWIQKTLIDAGVPESSITIDTAHKKSPAGGTTGNLIVKLKGTVKGPRRLLMAHMDTVPLCVGCQPFAKETGSVRSPKRTRSAATTARDVRSFSHRFWKPSVRSWIIRR